VNTIANVQLVIQAASVKLRNHVQMTPARMAGRASISYHLPTYAPVRQVLME
jgi:hypothetical protein